MKKYFFLSAIAALAMAGCAREEMLDTVEFSDNNRIDFSVVTNGVTRAADVTKANLTSFNVYGYKKTSGDAVISGAAFSGTSGGTFTSSSDYYWPSDDDVNFFAYAPTSFSVSVTPSASSLEFSVTPVAAAASQADLVAAYAGEKNKTNSAAGVSLTFAHAGSKITVKAKNTDSYLKFAVSGVKVVGLAQSGTATFSSTGWAWSNNTAPAASAASANSYELTISPAVNFNGSTAETALTAATNDWILVPQDAPAATDYYTKKVGSNLNGAYIAVNVVIKKSDDTAVYDGWACFPVALNWVEGKHYTYVIDLAGGGVKEKNTDPNAPGAPDGNDDSTDPGTGTGGNGTDDHQDHPFDPILKKDVIKFISVTVSDWTDGGSTNL